MLFTLCENYLKQFLKAYEKESEFINTKGTISYEKLIVCSNIILRKVNMRRIDDVFKEQKKAHKDQVVNSLNISQNEQGCITRTTLPDSYQKFLLKEDWYIKLFSNVQEYFNKDKSIKNKSERRINQWQKIHAFVTSLLKDLLLYYPQTNMNGS